MAGAAFLDPTRRRALARARDRLRALPLDATPSIAAIARDAAMSTDHFIRQFATVFGETPHRYRLRERLAEARRLVVLDALPLAAIGESLGFAHAAAFSAAFARQFGEPPSACRRRLQRAYPTARARAGVIHPGCFALMGALPAGASIFRKSPTHDRAQSPDR